MRQDLHKLLIQQSDFPNNALGNYGAKIPYRRTTSGTNVVFYHCQHETDGCVVYAYYHTLINKKEIKMNDGPHQTLSLISLCLLEPHSVGLLLDM